MILQTRDRWRERAVYSYKPCLTREPERITACCRSNRNRACSDVDFDFVTRPIIGNTQRLSTTPVVFDNEAWSRWYTDFR